MILSWNWKAWLRNQVFNMGNIGLNYVLPKVFLSKLIVNHITRTTHSPQPGVAVVKAERESRGQGDISLFSWSVKKGEYDYDQVRIEYHN